MLLSKIPKIDQDNYKTDLRKISSYLSKYPPPCPLKGRFGKKRKKSNACQTRNYIIKKHELKQLSSVCIPGAGKPLLRTPQCCTCVRAPGFKLWLHSELISCSCAS